MEVFTARQREELYGANRNQEGELLRNKLTQSSILRNGEFNIDKNSDRPGFQWSTVTCDDYKTTLRATEQGKQYDESYKQATGSCIPIRHEGIPLDTYKQTSTAEAFTDKGLGAKRGYIGNDPTTNWPDMTPKLIKDKKLGHSEYKDIYIPTGADLVRPHYAKISTANVKLPLPLDEKKHRINVSLGSEPVPVGMSSEASSNYLQTKPKRYDPSYIKSMKEEMEWNSRVFQEGDYNAKDGVKQTQFDIDFGKRPKGSTGAPLPDAGQTAEEQLDAAIEERLHFMPKLIEGSMKSDTARQDGDDGKKYHTKAHFNLGSHADKAMSMYYKDYVPFRAQMKPDRIKPVDAQVLNSNVTLPFRTSNREDYYGTNGSTANISVDNRAIRKSNMEKQYGKNVNFVNDKDSTNEKPVSTFQRDFRGPPKDYVTMKPATEKRCEFDFIESNGMLPGHKKQLNDQTENKDNFRGGVGVSQLVLNSDKARVKSAAKRRLKSGRRAHFTLGTGKPTYKTVSGDTFTGRPKDDDHIPAAGKVEKEAKQFTHFNMSENTQDMVTDPNAPTLQESRTAIDIYPHRRREIDHSVNKTTVMRSDFLPITERSYTVPQLKQMNAEAVKGSKAVAISHFFHTDTSSRNNYETTAMASFIKPELMSGKVHLSSLN